MKLDANLVFAFLLVFVRCSAMFLASPLFGSPNVPVRIRILSLVVISAALTVALRPSIGSAPADLYGLVAAVANQALAGLVIGIFIHLVLLGIQMGGAFIDVQMGLSMSHVVNPANGQTSTLIAQFKYMLALVVFLTVNGHHVMLQAFVKSYEVLPAAGSGTLQAIQAQQLALLGNLGLIALQIAAPVLAVSILVDAALGIMNKAVPQMHIFIVGLPAKLLMGMVALSFALPAVTGAVMHGVENATEAIWQVMRAKG